MKILSKTVHLAYAEHVTRWLRARYSLVLHTMLARNENANKRPIDFYTVNVRWKHTDRTLKEHWELACNTQSARREIDKFCVHQRQRTVDVPSAYVYRDADARNVRIAGA